MIKKCHYCKREFEVSIEEKQFCSQDCRDKQTKCQIKASKKYLLKNKEKICKYRKQYYQKNRQRELERHKKEYKTIKRQEYIKNYNLKNRKRRTEWQRNYLKNPINKLINYCRKRISYVLKTNKKSSKTMELIGCSIVQLKQHLENQFTKGMSWLNYGSGWYGKGKEQWHIDHIRPCSSFDLSDPEQQKIAFHYSNLQPLWAEDNLKKHAKTM
jgi:hypothetical protein